MFTLNYLSAKSFMKNNLLRSFAVYSSDLLSLLLFFTSLISVIYFFLFDTKFFASLGVFTNEVTLGLASFIAVIEITALYFIHFYCKLRKTAFFSFCDNSEFTLYDTARFSLLILIVNIKKLFSLFVFFSPFLLTVSAIFYLHDSGYPQSIIYLFVSCSSLLFISGLVFFRMYILKYSLVPYVFINYRNLSVSDVFRKSDDMTDGKIIRLFILKTFNLPKKMLSLFLLPALYFLPYCLYSEYDFLLQKENPYSYSVNTDKSVVFYMKECENL